MERQRYVVEKTNLKKARSAPAHRTSHSLSLADGRGFLSLGFSYILSSTTDTTKEHLEESNIKGGQVLSISYACPLLMSSSLHG